MRICMIKTSKFWRGVHSPWRDTQGVSSESERVECYLVQARRGMRSEAETYSSIIFSISGDRVYIK